MNTQKNSDSRGLEPFIYIKTHESITILKKKSSSVSFGGCQGTDSKIILKIDKEKGANTDSWERSKLPFFVETISGK